MEKPNMNYINDLARGDESIKKTIIDVIKSEFPEEQKDYYDSLKTKKFKKIEENVHRLKHKISILGLEKSYELANVYEHNLSKNNTEGLEQFEKTLKAISSYLKTI